jgi:hypothetical protein
MQNTAREAQPVSWSEILDVIKTNPHRNQRLDLISTIPAIDGEGAVIPWMGAGWQYRTSDIRAHPMTLVLLATDPLYEISAPNTRKEIEKEAATELATEFDTLYAKHNGRGRGWVKTQMTSELNLWAGGGTDLPFDWTSLAEKRKILSALIDIVCVKYCVRIAVWWSEHKRLSVWPIAEPDDESWRSAPLLNIEVLSSGEAHVMQSGEVRVRAQEWREVFKKIGEWQWARPITWPGIGSKSLGDLKTEYAELAGRNEADALPKRIDKDTLANVIYRYHWMHLRLDEKEGGFY